MAPSFPGLAQIDPSLFRGAFRSVAEFVFLVTVKEDLSLFLRLRVLLFKLFFDNYLLGFLSVAW